MTYTEIRQRVLAQLCRAMEWAEIPALLYTLADIALHRDAREAASGRTGRVAPTARTAQASRPA